MSVADRIEPYEYEDLESFLLAHEIKNIALKKLLAFVRKQAQPFPDRDDRREAIREEAVQILRELGEIE